MRAFPRLRVPLLRMAASFALGIALEDRWVAGPLGLAAVAAACAGASSAASFAARGANPSRRRARAPAALAAVGELGLGAALGALALALRLHAPVPALEGRAPVLLRVLEVSWSAPESCRIDVEILGARRAGRARLWEAPPLCAALPGELWLARAELESLRPATNPGGGDPRRSARRRGIRARLRVLDGLAERIRAPAGSAARIASLRARLNEVVDPVSAPGGGSGVTDTRVSMSESAFSLEHWSSLEPAWSRAAGPLVRALVTGDRSRLSPELQERFVASGTAHLLAVSGLNVACVFALVRAAAALLLRALPWLFVLRRRPLLAAAIGGLAAAGYTAVSGLAVPALRSALMAAAGVIAILGGRPAAAANALGGAALIVLALEPASLFEASFLLSFSAVAGLIAWRPPPRPGALLAALHSTLAASLATAPWVVWFGLPVPLGTALANAIAVPAFAVATPLALTAALLGALSPRCAALLAPLARAVTALAAAPLGALESADAFRGVPAPFACALALACAGFALRGFALRRVLAGSVLLALGFTALLAGLRGAPPPLQEPRFTFLDVGHGDAIVIQHAGRALLVDAGDARGAFDAGRAIVAPALRALGVRRLDALVLTHTDRDHVGGAAAVLRALPVDEVWIAPSAFDHPALGALRERSARQRVPLRLVRGGFDARIGGLEVRVHAAPPALAAASSNAASLVLEVRTAYGCAVLPGDAPAEVERALAPELGRCALLELAHHGSRTSSDRGWLAAIGPRFAVVSAGRRPRSPLPHREVIERLALQRTPWLSTEQAGAISVELGPRGLRVVPGWEGGTPGWEPAR